MRRVIFIFAIILISTIIFLIIKNEKNFELTAAADYEQTKNEHVKNSNNMENVVEKSEQILEGYGISNDGTVTMDDEYFGFIYYDIEANPRKYAAQKVVITGFIYKEPGTQDNEIKVSRILLQKCGSQEDELLGLICVAQNASDFENDEWVTVKGTLIVNSFINPKTKSESYKYYIEPESIEKIERNSDYTL